MENEKIIYSGYLKGAYVNQPGSDIHVLFGNDYEMYDLSVEYSQSRAGKDNYRINISKIEDLDISIKNIYLPRHFEKVDIDFNVVNREDIDFFAINGIFVINDNEVLSYIDNNSPMLMFANFEQLCMACKMTNEELPEYLDALRAENYDIPTIYINQELKEYSNIAIAQLIGLDEKYIVKKDITTYVSEKYGFNDVKEPTLPSMDVIENIR